MPTISNFGNRLPSLYTNTQQNDSKANALQKTQGGSASAPVSLSSDALDLSKRVSSLGNATVDFAQDFVSSFAQALFGDDAKGATIDFDSASLDVSSGYAMGVQQTRDANGVTNAAAFSMSDSSHFIGKGTITTADGRKFDFEVEVQYNFDLDAAASQTTSADEAQRPDSTPLKDLPTVQVPNIDFPGTLSDLFQLIGRDLHTVLGTGDKDGKGDSKAGDGIDRNTLRSLSLRLLNLVDSKDTNTYAPPSNADKAKAAAANADTPAAPTPSPAATDAAAAPAAEGAADDAGAPPATASTQPPSA